MEVKRSRKTELEVKKKSKKLSKEEKLNQLAEKRDAYKDAMEKLKGELKEMSESKEFKKMEHVKGLIESTIEGLDDDHYNASEDYNELKEDIEESQKKDDEDTEKALEAELKRVKERKESKSKKSEKSEEKK